MVSFVWCQMLNPRPYMPVVVTVALLGAALWVVLAPTADANSRQWATGIIGYILSYWMPGRTR